MREFITVKNNLYVLKSDVKKMEKGEIGIGHISVKSDEVDNYKLISKHAFQPITKEDILPDGSYKVVFIMS